MPALPIFNDLILNIGAMKAGTSWLYEILKDHPEINSVAIKEIHYFWDLHGNFRLLAQSQRIETARYHINRLLPQSTTQEVQALLAWCQRYLSDPIDDAWLANLFIDRAKKRYCAEFSNMYARLGPEAWCHVRSLTNNIRVIYLLRNPLHRMWSHVRFHAKIIGQSSELSKWDAAQYTAFMNDSGCIAMGNYSYTLQILAKTFTEAEYIVGHYEDIQARPLTLLRTIEGFLDLAPSHYDTNALNTVHNPTFTMEMPSSFLQAAVPAIRQELDALDGLKFSIPNEWIQSLHAS